MKKVYITILFMILSCSFGQAQDEEYPDDEDLGLFDIMDVIGIPSDFFSKSCPRTKSAQIRTNFVDYDQSSYKVDYGVGCKTCGKDKNEQCKISGIGCALTDLAMILKNSGYDVDPSSLQSWMAISDNHGFLGCSVLWPAISNYPDGKKKGKVTFVDIIKYNEPLDKARDIILGGGFATLKVNVIKVKDDGTSKISQHHILLYDYEGNGTTANLEDFIVSDPATQQENGKRRKLSNCFTGNYPSAKYHYKDIVSAESEVYKSKLYSVSGSGGADASYKVIDKMKNIELSSLLKINLYLEVKFTSIFSQLKSGTSYCNQLWVVTDPSGFKKTFSTNEFDYIFEQIGTYKVSLIVENGSGFDADVKTITVVDGTDPTEDSDAIVDFTVSPETGSGNCEPITFELKDHTLAGKVNWDFGDGYTDCPAGYRTNHSFCDGSGYFTVTASLISNSSIKATHSVYNPPVILPPAAACHGLYATAVASNSISVVSADGNALKITGPNFSWEGESQNATFGPLTPNSLYKIYSGDYVCKGKILGIPWGCEYFYDYDIGFDDCLLNVKTTPLTVCQRRNLSENEIVADYAINDITLETGFEYTPITASSTYTAEMILGPQQWTENIAAYSQLKSENVSVDTLKDLKMEPSSKPISIKKLEKIVAESKGISVFVYPNPNSGSFYIVNQAPYLQINLVEIINSQGVTIKTISDLENRQKVDLSDYGAGIYILKISTYNKLFFKKVIVN